MRACRECEYTVSEGAVLCPGCGADQPSVTAERYRRMRTSITAVGVILGLLFLGGLIAFAAFALGHG